MYRWNDRCGKCTSYYIYLVNCDSAVQQIIIRISHPFATCVIYIISWSRSRCAVTQSVGPPSTSKSFTTSISSEKVQNCDRRRGLWQCAWCWSESPPIIWYDNKIKLRSISKPRNCPCIRQQLVFIFKKQLTDAFKDVHLRHLPAICHIPALTFARTARTQSRRMQSLPLIAGTQLHRRWMLI